ncbi:hypothetical protein GQ54DRAFT_295866, partial [Martensiomyces pterosporus]
MAETVAEPAPQTACRLCETIKVAPDFLVFLQFGPHLQRSKRQSIERYIHQILYSEPAHSSARYERNSSRKRRRYNNSDSYGEYSNGYGDSDYDDDVFEEGNGRRQRDSGEAPLKTHGCESTLVFCDKTTGYTLDTSSDAYTDDKIDYEHGTKAIIGLTNGSAAAAAMGNACFNCSMPGHELRQCPMPLDQERIETNRQAFKDKGPGQFNGRFYLAVEEEKHMEELRKRFRPGEELSEALRVALGVEGGGVPEFVESMYYYGYPPAYLGSERGQDPMAARRAEKELVPPTPELKVYDDAEDYDDGDKGSSPNSKVEVEEGGECSDEEGAVSEPEAEPKDERQILVRNVPLVMYPGLDLLEFDFTAADRPGKPLRSRTPYRHTRSPYGSYSSQHGESYRSGRYRSRDDYYYHDSSYGGYPGSAPSMYSSRHGSTDDWAGMLDGYYRSSHETPSRGYAAAPAYDYGDRYYENQPPQFRPYDDQHYQEHTSALSETVPPPPAPPSQPPPPLPPLPPPTPPLQNGGEQQQQQQQSQTVAGSSQTLSSPSAQETTSSKDNASNGREQLAQKQQLPAAVDGNGSDSELEDGECDMSES